MSPTWGDLEFWLGSMSGWLVQAAGSPCMGGRRERGWAPHSRGETDREMMAVGETVGAETEKRHS